MEVFIFKEGNLILYHKLSAILGLLGVCIGLALPAGPARAEGEADWQMLQEIMEASNSVSEETAREAHKTCLDIGARLAQRSDVVEAQRLYFEALIESCVAYAMNNGNYSDASGDQCSHQFAYASKLRRVHDMQKDQPDMADLVASIGEQLGSAIHMADSLRCTQDFASLKLP